jgi:alkylhydroperoxidase family enzyme
MSEARLLPKPPPYSAPVAEALSRLMPEGVEPLALFRTLAANERVLSRMLSGGLLDRGAISLRERELVILRTCARLGSEYEWGVHVTFFASKARLSNAEVAATRSDAAASPPPLAGREALLRRLDDELVDTAHVSDALWGELGGQWTPEALVELVALVGFYHSVSFATNAFRIPNEGFAARFSQF